MIQGFHEPLLAPDNLLQLQQAVPIDVQQIVQQVNLILPHLRTSRASLVRKSMPHEISGPPNTYAGDARTWHCYCGGRLSQQACISMLSLQE